MAFRVKCILRNRFQFPVSTEMPRGGACPCVIPASKLKDREFPQNKRASKARSYMELIETP